MDNKPIYATNTSKALECILSIVHSRPSIDVYHVVKAAYFADKYHIASYGRPISGDTYAAAPYGPLPRVVYGLLNHDPIEILALNGNGSLPFKVDKRFRVTASRGPNLRKLSKTDVEALAVGLTEVQEKNFDQIFRQTHNDPAYINAEGSVIDYRDFIPDSDPEKELKAELISETAPYAVF